MMVGERIRRLREAKSMSQGDIEKRTGLLRCYISRVENGHTVPALETIEKIAAALDIPLYRFFYEGKRRPEVPKAIARAWSREVRLDSSSKDAEYLRRLRSYLGKMKAFDTATLLALASKMARR